MPDTKSFNLHIEHGRTGNGDYYCQTLLANGAIGIRVECKFQVDAFTAFLKRVQQDIGYDYLEMNPNVSQYPFVNKPPNAAKTQAAATQKAVMKPGTLEQPALLAKIPSPDCRPLCQSFDVFGEHKCHDMCKGIDGKNL